MMMLLKLITLLGCPLVLYGISIKNEALAESDNNRQESPSHAVQQTSQEQFTAGTDLLLDDDFDINSLINAEEDI